ncbi:MAG: SdpI family protein [Sphaerochaetaceae bacterium]
MSSKTINIIIIVLLVFTLIGILMVYSKLPAIVPIHWNYNGEVDNYGPKSTFWIIYLVIIGTNLLMVVISKIDPKKDNYKQFRRSFDIFRLILTLFLIIILAITISVSLGNEKIDIKTVIPALVGILFAIIGNYMPKFKHNYTMGIKTPWTLASENVWYKTHRMAAPVWVIGGVLLALIPFVFYGELTVIFFIIIVTAIVLIPTIYSYVIFNKEKR